MNRFSLRGKRINLKTHPRVNAPKFITLLINLTNTFQQVTSHIVRNELSDSMFF